MILAVWPAAGGQSAVEELRNEYGATLAGLIVARLVNQELDRLKLSLTDQERRAARRRCGRLSGRGL